MLQKKYSSGWWFQIFLIFTPIWVKWSILTNIFQVGWFNHQLVMSWWSHIVPLQHIVTTYSGGCWIFLSESMGQAYKYNFLPDLYTLSQYKLWTCIHLLEDIHHKYVVKQKLPRTVIVLLHFCSIDVDSWLYLLSRRDSLEIWGVKRQRVELSRHPSLLSQGRRPWSSRDFELPRFLP